MFKMKQLTYNNHFIKKIIIQTLLIIQILHHFFLSFNLIFWSEL